MVKNEKEEEKEELKPCPFCGAKVSMTYNSAENAYSIWHERTACMLEEPIKINGAFVKSLTEAAKAWNRRIRQ